MSKIKTTLCSKKGESLIESLISILIFSLLIVTITLTIATALRITDQATEDADQAQERVNEIIAGIDFTGTDEVIFTFTYTTPDDTGAPATNEREVSHEVTINEEENKKAFRPRGD